MINNTFSASNILVDDQALVPALNSITSHQVDAVAKIARASGQDWNVQAVDDYDGYRSVLIETIMHGHEQKSFFVAGTAHHLELFENIHDRLAVIGTFTEIKALEACLTEAIRDNDAGR